MIPYLLAAVGGYLIGQSQKKDVPQMADGGMAGHEKLYFVRFDTGDVSTSTTARGGTKEEAIENARKSLKLGDEKVIAVAEINKKNGVPFADGGMMAKGGEVETALSKLKKFGAKVEQVGEKGKKKWYVYNDGQWGLAEDEEGFYASDDDLIEMAEEYAGEMAKGGYIQDGDDVKMAFNKKTVLEIYESDDSELDNPVEEIFNEGEVFEVIIFGIDKYKYDVQFGDGSVAFIRKEDVNVIEVNEEKYEDGGEMAKGGKVLVGRFDEKQLRNGEDKKAIEKKMKETGLKYIDSRIIKKNGKPHIMEVYLYADGGMMAKGGKVKSKKWIQDALGGDEGSLRRTAKRKGLLRGDENLSMTDLKKLQKMGGKTGKRAHLAETLRKFDDGGMA